MIEFSFFIEADYPGEYEYSSDLGTLLRGMFSPDNMESSSDEELSEAIHLFHEISSKVLIEAQRRGTLQDIMKQAMELDGAPKGE